MPAPDPGPIPSLAEVHIADNYPCDIAPDDGALRPPSKTVVDDTVDCEDAPEE